MCGLSGFLLNGKLTVAKAERRLRAMVDTILYRGPDDCGIWSDGKAGLAFARLAIIDLSPAGHQPMSVLDGRVWLTFNGEIYNFQLLRSELERCGHIFNSRSDSEVILRGYLQWGDRVLERLRGMFAIALWDARQSKLLLARDRLGKKPLVYLRIKAGLLFGSEIKTILAWPQVKPEPDLEALHQFLTYQYIPAPKTAFKGIKKLPAGHKMTVAFDAGGHLQNHKIEKYWQLPAPRPCRSKVSEAQLAEELAGRLDEAVRIRMLADVPLGAFLSGGVDSSAVVAMMARRSSQPLKTFSIGFDNPGYDETRYAQMVADRYSTDHHVCIVRPDAVEILPRLVHHYNEPFADSSAVPSFYLAKLARRHVTVALNGDGGDEAFAGYGRYRSMARLQQSDSIIDNIPQPLRGLGAGLLAHLPVAGWKKKRRKKIARQLLADRPAGQHRYAFTITAFSDEHKLQGYGDAMQPYLQSSALNILSPYFAQADDLVTGANWSDIHTYLPDDLMVKVDIATMAHSLESRSPFLDHTFMEWALTIPENYVITRQQTKAIFKKAMRPYLPEDVLYRPKMGFGCPVDDWFRHELKEMAYDMLLSDRFLCRGIITAEFVRRLLDRHCDNEDHAARLWSLLMLELWFRMWIDR